MSKNNVDVYSSRDPIYDDHRDCGIDHVTYQSAESCDKGSSTNTESSESSENKGK